MNLGELVILAQRAQKTIENAMEAAFGAALVRVIAMRDDDESPLDKRIIPVFEKAYAKVVSPVFDILDWPITTKTDDDDDLQAFILGSLRDSAEKANHDFFMARVQRLIADSQARDRQISAPFN